MATALTGQGSRATLPGLCLEGPVTTSLTKILDGELPVPRNQALMERICALRGRPLIALVLDAGVPLDTRSVTPLLEVMRTLPRGPVDIFLDQLGRAGPETWRIVAMLRERFTEITALVPFAASPGATQVALGADELVMTECASLSPLEPARTRVNDAGEPDLAISAFDVRHYLRFLQEQLDAPLAPDSPALVDLWSRLDPLVVGATARSHEGNVEVTRRCLQTHLSDPSTLDAVLDELGSGRLSHRFPVTARDCERMGLAVVRPGEALTAAITDLHAYYQHTLGLEGALQTEDQHYTVSYDGFVDTVQERRMWLRITRTDERGRALSDKPPLRRWTRPDLDAGLAVEAQKDAD